MKVYQPLAVIGFSFGGALLFVSLLPFRYTTVAMILTGALAVGFLVYCLLKGFTMSRAILLAALLMALLGSAVNAVQRIGWAHKAGAFPASPVSITGTVEEVFPSNKQTRSYLVKTESIDIPGMAQKERLLLYSASDVEFRAGEKVGCLITGFQNVPTRSQLGKGAQATGWIRSESETVLAGAPAARQWMEKLRFQLKVHIKQAVPAPYDTVMIAMFLGDSSEMNTEIYDSFSLTGISHILCVSGLHITLIGGLISGLLQLIFGKRIFPDLAGLAVMIFFVTLTGAKMPSVRVLIMAATLMLTRHIIRDYSPLNTLGGVVLFFCLLEPSVVYQTGFLMSVASVCALCAVAPCWTRGIVRKLSVRSGFISHFISIFCASGAVSVFLIPIMMLFNGYTSLLSPIANLIVLPAVPCVMVLGAVCAIAGGTGIGALAGNMGGVLLKLMVFVAEKLGKNPLATLPLNLSFIKIWMMSTALLILIAAAAKQLRNNRKQIAVISAVILAVGMAAHFATNYNVLQITTLANDDGRSVVASQNGRAVVIGCGGNKTIGSKTAYYMRSIGVRTLEMLVISDGNTQQTSGVSSLVTLMEPQTAVAPPGNNNLSALYDLEDSKLIPLSDGQWEALNGVTIKVEQGRTVLDGNGQQFFVEADSSLGILQDGEELLLETGQKGDTLKPKYDIITTDVIEELEKNSFSSLSRGESLVIQVAKNGKMTVRRKEKCLF